MKRVRNGARKAAHRVSIPHRAVEATIDTLRIGQNGSLMITDRTVDFGSSRKRKKLDPPPALPSHPWSDPSSVDPTTSTSSPSHSPTPSLDCPLPVEQSFARSGIPSMPSPQTPAAKATVEPSKPTKIKVRTLFFLMAHAALNEPRRSRSGTRSMNGKPNLTCC